MYFCLLGLPKDESDEEFPKKNKKTNLKLLGESEEREHPLITDLDYRDKNKKRLHKAALWFERDAFQNLINEKDEDADLDKMMEDFKKRGAKIIGEETQKESKSKKNMTTQVVDKPANGAVNSDSASSNEDTDSDSDSDSDYDVNKYHTPVNNANKDGFEIVKEVSGNIFINLFN